MVGLVLVTPPAQEPLTVADVKAHLRLDSYTGEIAPTALTAAIASPAAPGNVNNGAHCYCLTFVTSSGETDAGDTSGQVTIVDNTINGKVQLTGIPTGGANVIARRIYRTAANGATYLLLTELADNTTTTYTDNTADASLGTAAPSINTTEDPYLESLITTARLTCEDFTKRKLITQTWKQYFDHWPRRDTIELFLPPVQSITGVEYTDTNGTTQTLSTTLYNKSVTGERARIRLADGCSWPDLQSSCMDGVSITVVCGYGADRGDVPAPLRQGMLSLIGHLYNQREDVVVGTITSEVPMTSQYLWTPYISREF